MVNHNCQKQMEIFPSLKYAKRLPFKLTSMPSFRRVNSSVTCTTVAYSHNAIKARCGPKGFKKKTNDGQQVKE